jgi:hypothetical protein
MTFDRRVHTARQEVEPCARRLPGQDESDWIEGYATKTRGEKTLIDGEDQR